MPDASDHWNGRRFFNPTGPAPQPFTAVPRMLMERRTKWPLRVDVRPQRPAALDRAWAVVTFIGHATFLIQTPHGNLLTDPIYSERAGPFNVFGPRRVRQPAVRFEDLPPIATVLLSHNHYDHCDRPTLRRLARRFDPVVITPIRNGSLVRSTGIRRVEELALLPIGAYEPRWFMSSVHMNPEEAVQAHLDLDGPPSIAMHYGTFQLTTEGIDEPVRALAAACAARHVEQTRFRTIGFGESVHLR